jgi:phosphatidylglycerophosphate synthase
MQNCIAERRVFTGEAGQTQGPERHVRAAAGGSRFRMIPNILTGFRIFLAVVIMSIVIRRPDDLKAAAGLFLIAIFTDFLDGQFARRLKQQSDFGAMFDLTADRLLMSPLLIVILAAGLLNGTRGAYPVSPILYVVIIVYADISTLIGIFLFTRIKRRNPSATFPTPTMIVKSTYPVQASVVFFALLKLKPELISSMMYLATMFTVLAYVSYLRKGGWIFPQGMKALFGGRRDEEEEAG